MSEEIDREEFARWERAVSSAADEIEEHAREMIAGRSELGEVVRRATWAIRDLADEIGAAGRRQAVE
jgi:hypothetical protein